MTKTRIEVPTLPKSDIVFRTYLNYLNRGLILEYPPNLGGRELVAPNPTEIAIMGEIVENIKAEDYKPCKITWKLNLDDPTQHNYYKQFFPHNGKIYEIRYT